MSAVGAGTARRVESGWVALLAAVLVLSLGSTVSKKIGASGVIVACVRSFLAFGMWVGILIAQGRRLTWSSLRMSLGPGALFGINIAFFFSAVTHTAVANVEFLGSLTPLIVVPAGALLFHEHIPWRALVWGVPAILGVALVAFLGDSGRGDNDALGLTMALCAITTWSIYLLVVKRVRARIDVGVFMAGMALGAGLILLPLAIRKGFLAEIPARGWPWLILLTVMNGVVAHTLLLVAQKTVPVGSIATLQVSQPALAAFAAWVLLGETVTAGQIVGMVIVLGSLVMYTLTVQRSKVLLDT
jgi:drug/metabolite transporter (DMT)-like permease